MSFNEFSSTFDRDNPIEIQTGVFEIPGFVDLHKSTDVVDIYKPTRNCTIEMKHTFADFRLSDFEIRYY